MYNRTVTSIETLCGPCIASRVGFSSDLEIMYTYLLKTLFADTIMIKQLLPNVVNKNTFFSLYEKGGLHNHLQ